MSSQITSQLTQATTMKAAMFYAPGDVRYEEVAIPQPGPGEIVVKVGMALTCGTDLKCFRRGHPVLLKEFPSPFGHEFAGTVYSIGEDVENFTQGERVVVANSAPCYECFYCCKGKYNLCSELDLLNGAYAQYIKIPARITAHNTYTAPDYIPFEALAFAEPLAIALRGIELCGVGPGDRVAIMGLGAIGQLLIRVAKWKGAHVTAFGRNAFKRHMAIEFGGADAVVNLGEMQDAKEIREAYTPQGQGFDVVIEAIGLPQTWEKSVELVRRGGVVNLFGGCQSGSTVTFDTGRLHYDEITLLSLFHHTPPFFRKAVDLIISGEIDPTLLITDTVPLAQVTDALERVEKGEAIKIAIQP